MSFKIYASDSFEKELKKLAKKYPSIKNDYKALIDSLIENPKQGDALGKDCYKIRMAIASKGRGKSANESISDKELDELLKLGGIQ